MKLLPIDFEHKNAIPTIDDWVDMWSVERYGNDENIEEINGKKRLNPAWFYGNDKRYIYTQIIKHNEEHATIEHVRELLLKIKNINYRLSDEGQIRHLTFDEREKLKAERHAFYDEYTLIVKRTGGEQAAKSIIAGEEQRDKFDFNDEQTESLKAIYDHEFSDKEHAPVDYDEFKVLCNYGNFSGLLKQAPDGHTEISNQVCRLYYNIWKIWDKDDKEKRNNWKMQAVKILAKYKPNITWPDISKQAYKTKKNDK